MKNNKYQFLFRIFNKKVLPEGDGVEHGRAARYFFTVRNFLYC